MSSPATPSAKNHGLSDEVFAFIAKLLPVVDLASYAVVIGFSSRPWLTLLIAACFPLIGVGGLALAKRLDRNIAKPQMSIIVLLHLLICSTAGPQSPAWLICIPGLVASIFLVHEAKWKIAFLCAILIAAAVGNYFSGKDLPTILTVSVALGAVSVLLFRTHQFLSAINTRLQTQVQLTVQEQEKSRRLLLNILPDHIVAELSATGKVKPARHEAATVLFTDFAGFTQATASMPPDRIVAELNDIFAAFDTITAEEGVEKIKTMGDAYMAAAGLAEQQPDHAQRCVRTALRFQAFMADRNRDAAFKWNLRAGIHSGPVVAGVVGLHKYAFDIWGDAVNIASRIESAGEAGRVNVSAYTYDLVRRDFDCSYRGKIDAKGKGEIDMYFVNTPVC